MTNTTNVPTIKTHEIKNVQDVPIAKTQKFWDYLKEGKVYATKCAKCGKIYFPPVADCGECLSSEVQWVPLSSEAEIETFTHVMVRPLTFSNHEPYVVAIGRLKEGVKVLAWLSGFKPSQVKIGMKAKLVAKVSPEGNPTYEFVPLK